MNRGHQISLFISCLRSPALLLSSSSHFSSVHYSGNFELFNQQPDPGESGDGARTLVTCHQPCASCWTNLEVSSRDRGPFREGFSKGTRLRRSNLPRGIASTIAQVISVIDRTRLQAITLQESTRIARQPLTGVWICEITIHSVHLNYVQSKVEWRCWKQSFQIKA